MRKELIVKDRAIDYEVLKQFFYASSGYQIDNLCLPSGMLNVFPDLKQYVNLVSLIDYPSGWLSTRTRMNDIDYSIKTGAKIIDLTIPFSMFEQNNYQAIERDLKKCISICDKSDIEYRAIIEYRLFETEYNLEMCLFLKSLGFKTIITSTGTMLDDAIDNLIISKKIQETTKMEVIVCGVARSRVEYDLLNMEYLNGIRFTSIVGAKNILGDL